MGTKQHLAEQAEKITEKLRHMSHRKPWAESMMYLMQLPGFGVITGMTVLAAIGEIKRFESPKHLVSIGVEFWIGAKRGEAARQEDHQGRAQRSALGDGEVAQRAVKSDPLWKTVLTNFNDACTETRPLWLSHVVCWPWSGTS